MKWKRVPTEFLPEKTFLIIKDDLEALEVKQNSHRRGKPKSAADTGTWPPKLKNHHNHHDGKPYGSVERPKTANLERPSVLDPRLLKKLDMSLVSKEVLCDSMTRIQLSVKSRNGGGTSSNTSVSSRRRQSVPASEKSQPLSSTISHKQQVSTFYEEEKRANSLPFSVQNSVQKKRSSFEHLTTTEETMKKQSVDSQENFFKQRSSDTKRLDDNNNKNNINSNFNNNGASSSKISLLTTVRKNKTSKREVSSEIEVFTGVSSKIGAPEPCKTCGRPDQPERFHSHPKGSFVIKKENVKDINGKMKNSVPKTIQKPVALNFRSEKSKSKIKAEDEMITDGKITSSVEDTNSKTPGSAARRGPRTVTCYICAREFGTASFPIHEPKCMQKWSRENNALPASQRRQAPQRPIVPLDHYDWNTAAWEQSQAQLIPCWKCGRTFLPDRLEVHQRSCKSTRKVSSQISPTSGRAEDHQGSLRPVAGPTTVLCQICGRNFGSRSIKIHDTQCRKKWEADNEALPMSQRKKNPPRREKSADTRDSISSPTRQAPQLKPTTTCYICGRDFGNASIAIHEPQCLKKWQIENEKLPPDQRREEPEKPEIVYTSESAATGSPVIDWAATTEARWKSHLGQLVACKQCKRTFNPDRVAIHERSCKGTR